MSKGAATTMSSIIIIILLVGMLATYIVTVNDEIKKEMEISLKKAEILRAKNTFYLLNQSLETTWFISTVQTIFRTGENFPASVCQGNLKENLEAYMKKMMEDVYIRIPVYGNSIPINEVSINIIQITPNIIVEDDKIISDVSETITANYVETDIVADTMHENIITTYFKKLAEYGCRAIALIPAISSTMPQYSHSTTHTRYLRDAENHIAGMFNSIATEYGITKSLIKNSLFLSTDLSGLTLNYDFTGRFTDVNEYYYHDEAANRFVKKPFSLYVRMADSVNVLSCSHNGLYNWNSRDMLCCGSLYTCGIGDGELPGINGNNLGPRQQRCGYACTGSYFCTSGEAQTDPTCCVSGWGRQWITGCTPVYDPDTGEEIDCIPYAYCG